MAIGMNAQTGAPADLTDFTEGWYQIQYNGSRTAAAQGQWYISYQKEFAFKANNKYYPIGTVAEIPAGEEARTFFYLTPVEPSVFYLQTVNGHYVNDTGMASIAPSNSYVNDAGDGFKYLYPFEEGTDAGALNHEFDFFVGRSYNATEAHSIYAVDVSGYDIYKVVIERPEEESHTYPYDYTTVTYTGEAPLASVSSVYDGGYFFFPKGTTIDPSDFVAPEIANYDTEAYIDENYNLVMTYQPAVDFANITYCYFYGEEEVASETLLGVVGEGYPEPKYGFPYGVSASAPEGIVEYDEEININVTVSGLPFQYKDEISSLDDVEHWYNLVLKSSSYVVYDPDLEYIELTYTEIDQSNKEAYRWAFVGNPFTGYKLVNEKAGIDYVLASPRTANNDGNGGGNTLAYMQELEGLDEYTDAWMYHANPSSYITGVEGFFLGYKDEASGKVINLNNRGNKLAYWDSGSDSGSTFYCEEVFAPEKTLSEAIKKANASLDAAALTVGTVGYPTALAVDSMRIVIAEAQSLYDNPLDGTDFYSVASQLTSDISRFEEQVMFPEDGKYYSFVNHQQNGTFITMYMAEEGLVAAVGKTPDEVGSAAAFYATIHQDADGDDFYLFYSPDFDRYLIWRGHNGGYNDNKGYTDEADDNNAFYLFTSQQYLAGTFLIAGYRGNGNVGTFIFLKDGSFNAFSLAYGWTDSYSNLFTIEEVSYSNEADYTDCLPLTGGWNYEVPLTGSVDLCFNSQWGELMLSDDAVVPGDYTGYVVEYTDAQGGVQLKVTQGSTERYIPLEGSGTYEGSFADFTEGTALSAFNVQGTEAGASITLKKVTLIAADDTHVQTSYKKSWGTDVLIYSAVVTFTAQWGQVGGTGWVTDIPEGSEAVYTFVFGEPAPAGLQLKVVAADGTETYPGIEEGSTQFVYTTSTALKELSLQATAADVEVDVKYVKLIVQDGSHVDTVLAGGEEAKVYDLFGRVATQLQPGTIYISGGRKFIVK